MTFPANCGWTLQLQSTSGGEGDFGQADCLGDEGIRRTEENHFGKAKLRLFINCNDDTRAAKSRAGSPGLVCSNPLAFARLGFFFLFDWASRRWEWFASNRSGVGGGWKQKGWARFLPLFVPSPSLPPASASACRRRGGVVPLPAPRGRGPEPGRGRPVEREGGGSSGSARRAARRGLGPAGGSGGRWVWLWISSRDVSAVSWGVLN